MKMRRFTALVTLVVFMFSCFATVSADATETGTSFADVTSDAQYAEAIQKLFDDGIVDGYLDENGVRTYKPDATITRGEFTKLLVATMLKKVPATLNAVSCGFNDVDTDPTVSWTIPYIDYAVKASIINGYEDGTFRAKNTVTFAEAVKMVVCAMGYSTVVEKTEPWYDGYLKIAQSIGILNGAYTGADVAASRGLVAQLIFNMNTSDKHITAIPGLNNGQGGSIFDIPEEDVLSIMDMVTAVENEGVEGQAGLQNGTIKVGNKTLKVTAKSDVKIDDLYKYLGKFLSVDYVEDGSSNVVKSISAYGLNSTVTVDAEDIINVTGTYLEYDNNGKEKQIKYNDDLKIIHNGVGVPDLDSELIKELLQVENGSITFVNGDNSSVYDAAFVTSYDVFFVATKGSDSDKTITDKYMKVSGVPKSITFDEQPENIEYKTHKGASSSYSAIKTDSVVSVARPYNRDTWYGVTKVIISANNTKSGMIKAQSDDVFTVGSSDIELSNYYLNLVEIEPSQVVETGDSATFYLDHENKLVAISVSDTNKYGYIASVEIDIMDKDNVTLNIISSTSSSVKEYTLAKKVNVNGESGVNADKVPDKLSASADIINEDKASEIVENASYSQPIIFKTKSNGEINSITTVDTGDDAISLEYSLGKATDKYKYYSGNIFKLDGTAKFNMTFNKTSTNNVTTTVFVVPKDREKDDEYQVITTSSQATKYFTNLTEYDVEAFGVNSQTKNAQIVVVYGGTDPKVAGSTKAVIIDKITSALDPITSEPSKRIDYYILGADDEDSENKQEIYVHEDYVTTLNSLGLAKGDIVKFAEKNDRVTLVEKIVTGEGHKLYNPDQDEVTGNLSYQHRYDDGTYYNAYVGTVYSFDGSQLQLINKLSISSDKTDDEIAGMINEVLEYTTSTDLFIIDLDASDEENKIVRCDNSEAIAKILSITGNGLASASKVFVSKLGETTSSVNAVVIFN